MYPYYQSENVTIYHGDCRDILPALQADSIDLVITSPPYNCRKEYGDHSDEIPWPEYYAKMKSVINETYRTLCLGGTLALNVPGVIRYQHDHAYRHTWQDFDESYLTHRKGVKVNGRGRIEPLGFNLFNMMRECDPHMREPIIWVKGSEPGREIAMNNAMGSDNNPHLRATHEMILLGSKGRWYHRGGTGRRGKKAVPFTESRKDTWYIPPVSSRDHPAVFPIEIPQRLIEIFAHAPDVVVADWFMGSGSTLVAAIQDGRKTIGIEIEEAYCEIAVNRIIAQGDL